MLLDEDLGELVAEAGESRSTMTVGAEHPLARAIAGPRRAPTGAEPLPGRSMLLFERARPSTRFVLLGWRLLAEAETASARSRVSGN